MVLVEVHREPLFRKYHASPFSCAFLFLLGATLSVLLLPFFMAYGPYGLWLKTSSYLERPRVDFTHKVVLFAEGYKASGESFDAFFSSVSSINALFEGNLRVPVLRAMEVDSDMDGLKERFEINALLPLEEGEQIHTVTMLVFLRTRLQERAKVEMDSLAYFQKSSGLPGRALHVDGCFELQQEGPISVYGGFTYPYSGDQLLDVHSTVSSGQVLVQRILESYASRNLTMALHERHSSWERMSVGAEGNAFNITATLRVNAQAVLYTPSVSEVLQDGWIKYLSMFIVVMYVVDKLSSFVFFHQLVEAWMTQTDSCRSCQ